LFSQSIQEVHKQLKDRKLNVHDLIDESIQKIAERDEQVKAFITVDEEFARSQAKQLEDVVQTTSLLYGLPIGIKDNIVTEGLRTTCASQFLKNFQPVYDATVVKKLKTAQTITIGKLNMDEFAMGGSNENSSFFATRNPWNLDHVPGGSSGGSAAAVAAATAAVVAVQCGVLFNLAHAALR
jgi:aspartyl-tRNA(Asn)/glutamyl-tRNA(Gln) amidotransferase subunit A